MIFIISLMYSVNCYRTQTTMEISTANTWKVGQKITCSDIEYQVEIYKLDGIPIRCLADPSTPIPCAIIMHILGHGDWTYFDDFSPRKNQREGFPRVLNDWREQGGFTLEETIQIQENLTSALRQAIYLFEQINQREICTCRRPRHEGRCYDLHVFTPVEDTDEMEGK
jgi:hypothetical protein